MENTQEYHTKDRSTKEGRTKLMDAADKTEELPSEAQGRKRPQSNSKGEQSMTKADIAKELVGKDRWELLKKASEGLSRNRIEEKLEEVFGAGDTAELARILYSEVNTIKPMAFWTVEDVAQYLQLQESTIYTWAQEDKIPHIKLGRMVRFREEDIKDWIESKVRGK